MSRDMGGAPQRLSDDDVDRLITALVADPASAAGTDVDEVQDLLAAAAGLRALAADPIPAETRARHLARIRAVAPAPVAAPLPARARGTISTLHRRLAATTAALATAVVFSGGTYAMAQEAQPGDALYGMKRATERLALAAAQDPDRASALRLAHAQRRLEEAQRRPDLSEQLVDEALTDVEAATGNPGRAVDTLRALLADEGLPTQASDQARLSVARACVRVATRHGRDVPDECAAAAQAPAAGTPGPAQPGRPAPPDGRGRPANPGPPAGQPGQPGQPDGNPGKGKSGTVPDDVGQGGEVQPPQPAQNPGPPAEGPGNSDEAKAKGQAKGKDQ